MNWFWYEVLGGREGAFTLAAILVVFTLMWAVNRTDSKKGQRRQKSLGAEGESSDWWSSGDSWGGDGGCGDGGGGE